MRRVLDNLADRQHLVVIALSLWLVLTSPWVSLRRSIPATAGFVDWAHIVIGLILVPLSLAYFATNTLGGRWREYFPWLAGDLAGLRKDLAGIPKGRLPQPGGGGLYSIIEGVAILLLVATAFTGGVWFLLEGSRAALVWRDWHVAVADGLVVVLVLHALAASLHLLEFLLD